MIQYKKILKGIQKSQQQIDIQTLFKKFDYDINDQKSNVKMIKDLENYPYQIQLLSDHLRQNVQMDAIVQNTVIKQYFKNNFQKYLSYQFNNCIYNKSVNEETHLLYIQFLCKQEKYQEVINHSQEFQLLQFKDQSSFKYIFKSMCIVQDLTALMESLKHFQPNQLEQNTYRQIIHFLYKKKQYQEIIDLHHNNKIDLNYTICCIILKCYIQLYDDEKALEHFQYMSQSFKIQKQIIHQMFHVFNNAQNQKLQQVYLDIIEVNPDQIIISKLITLYTALMNYEDAIKLFKRTLHLGIENNHHYNQIFNILIKQMRYNEILRYYDNMKIQPDLYNLSFVMDVYRVKGFDQKLIDTYNQYKDQNNIPQTIHEIMLYYYDALFQYDKTIEIYTFLQENYQVSNRTICKALWAYFRIQKYDKLLEAIDLIDQNEENITFINENILFVLSRINMFEKIIDFYHKIEKKTNLLDYNYLFALLDLKKYDTLLEKENKVNLKFYKIATIYIQYYSKLDINKALTIFKNCNGKSQKLYNMMVTHLCNYNMLDEIEILLHEMKRETFYLDEIAEIKISQAYIKNNKPLNFKEIFKTEKKHGVQDINLQIEDAIQMENYKEIYNLFQNLIDSQMFPDQNQIIQSFHHFNKKQKNSLVAIIVDRNIEINLSLYEIIINDDHLKNSYQNQLQVKGDYSELLKIQILKLLKDDNIKEIEARKYDKKLYDQAFIRFNKQNMDTCKQLEIDYLSKYGKFDIKKGKDIKLNMEMLNVYNYNQIDYKQYLDKIFFFNNDILNLIILNIQRTSNDLELQNLIDQNLVQLNESNYVNIVNTFFLFQNYEKTQQYLKYYLDRPKHIIKSLQENPNLLRECKQILESLQQ